MSRFLPSQVNNIPTVYLHWFAFYQRRMLLLVEYLLLISGLSSDHTFKSPFNQSSSVVLYSLLFYQFYKMFDVHVVAQI